LVVASAEPRIVAETERVLLSRFEEFLPSLFSSVESTSVESTISFTFKHGAPALPILEYLYQTTGSLRASLADDSAGSTWFTEQDIARAVLAYDGSSRVLRIRLTPEAGQRVVRLTSQNLGKAVRVTLDNEVLLEATINGVFGEPFQVTAPDTDTDTALALTVILETGALPASVSTGVPDGI
jgi:hypothetical protein